MEHVKIERCMKIMKENNHEEQKAPGVIIAAPKSGSGKTLITCAMIQAFLNRSIHVHSYKCGPDYIDPMFHRTVLGVPGGNLDTFFTGTSQTEKLFLNGISQDSFAVVEGVMGLFDGMGGVKEEGSTYDLAKALHLPVILVVDVKGMGRSVLPLLSGFLSFDEEHLICGVILNRVSEGFYPILSEMIQKELEIEVLGYFPEQKNLSLESRHLGLKMPNEVEHLKKNIQMAASILEKTVNVKRILELGQKNVKRIFPKKDTFVLQKDESGTDKPVLAVARDEAFCFYYQENMDMLKMAGFQIQEFSPIYDKSLPDKTCAILLGGGYPELYAKRLAANIAMKNAIQEAVEKKIPSVAECGGFMYLHKTLVDERGNRYPMVGSVEGICEKQEKLVRFGYVSVSEKSSCFLPEGEEIKGHEFHYYDSSDNGSSCVAQKPVGKKSWDCIWEGETHWWGFPHLYYPSNPVFVKYFYEAAKKYRKQIDVI